MEARLDFAGNRVGGKFLKYIVSAEKVVSDSTRPAATRELVNRRGVRSMDVVSARTCTRKTTVFAFDIAGSRIKHIWAIRNPDKLRLWTRD